MFFVFHFSHCNLLFLYRTERDFLYDISMVLWLFISKHQLFSAVLDARKKGRKITMSNWFIDGGSFEITMFL